MPYMALAWYRDTRQRTSFSCRRRRELLEPPTQVKRPWCMVIQYCFCPITVNNSTARLKTAQHKAQRSDLPHEGSGAGTLRCRPRKNSNGRLLRRACDPGLNRPQAVLAAIIKRNSRTATRSHWSYFKACSTANQRCVRWIACLLLDPRVSQLPV